MAVVSEFAIIFYTAQERDIELEKAILIYLLVQLPC